ncbi:MAG: cation:proton antiporter [Acidimicrobiia bacterium]
MPSADLLVELGLVLVGLAALGRLAGRFGLSPVPLYLVAGLGFGEGGILPLGPTEDFIEVGAGIGAVLLLFSLGLEYSPAELAASLRTQRGAGLVDALLNFTPGMIAGLALGWDTKAALLLGGITWVSSSGVVAKLLTDLGRIGNRETPAVLSILVIEDLAMAAYLPLMATLLVEGSAASVAASVVAALGAVALAGWLAFRHGNTFSRAVFSQSDEVLLLSVLGLTLLVAGLAEAVHISAAVGAFFVGITLSGRAADSARALTGPLRDLFAAVFFVFFGLAVDPFDLLPVAVVALLLGAVSCATKIATGWWAAARMGVGRAGRLRAGTILVAHGEFSVVVASLGLAAGIEDDLGAVAAGYVLVTAVAGPLLVKGLGRPSPPGAVTAPPLE